MGISDTELSIQLFALMQYLGHQSTNVMQLSYLRGRQVLTDTVAVKEHREVEKTLTSNSVLKTVLTLFAHQHGCLFQLSSHRLWTYRSVRGFFF